MVSLSTAEAELYALTDGAKELYYEVRIAAEMCMGHPFEDHMSFPVPQLFCDNISTIKVAQNKGEKPAVVKHIDVRRRWLIEREVDRDFALAHVETTKNVADLFTKPLPAPAFFRFRTGLGLSVPDETNHKAAKGSVNTCTHGRDRLNGDEVSGHKRRYAMVVSAERSAHLFDLGLRSLMCTSGKRRCQR